MNRVGCAAVNAGASSGSATGCARSLATGTPNKYSFVYNANNHETSAKAFSFPIYSDGGTTIPARAASAGRRAAAPS